MIARFPPYVSSEIVILASAEITDALVRRGVPTVVVADLYDVEGFAVAAPIAAILAAPSIVTLIERVDLIARRPSVRVAAPTAGSYLWGWRRARFGLSDLKPYDPAGRDCRLVVR